MNESADLACCPKTMRATPHQWSSRLTPGVAAVNPARPRFIDHGFKDSADRNAPQGESPEERLGPAQSFGLERDDPFRGGALRKRSRALTHAFLILQAPWTRPNRTSTRFAPRAGRVDSMGTPSFAPSRRDGDTPPKGMQSAARRGRLDLRYRRTGPRLERRAFGRERASERYALAREQREY